jgi:hypothetical protein
MKCTWEWKRFSVSCGWPVQMLASSVTNRMHPVEIRTTVVLTAWRHGSHITSRKLRCFHIPHNNWLCRACSMGRDTFLHRLGTKQTRILAYCRSLEAFIIVSWSSQILLCQRGSWERQAYSSNYVKQSLYFEGIRSFISVFTKSAGPCPEPVHSHLHTIFL